MQKHDFSENKFKDWATEIISEVPIIVQKIMDSCEVEEECVQELLMESLRYLDLVSYTKQRLTPSILVDYAWHEFILCTELYERFCLEKFGRFIHHHPGARDKETQNKFKKTIKFYILYIGRPSEVYWGDFAKEEWEQSQCGSCQS